MNFVTQKPSPQKEGESKHEKRVLGPKSVAKIINLVQPKTHQNNFKWQFDQKYREQSQRDKKPPTKNSGQNQNGQKK